MKNYHVRSAVAAACLLAAAALASPADDARNNLQEKRICSLLIKYYDSNPNRTATIGELLVAADQASTYGAERPTARPVPDGEDSDRVIALEGELKVLRDSLRTVGFEFRSHKAGTNNRLDSLESGGPGLDPRVDGIVRTVTAQEGAIADMDRAIAELREQPAASVNQTPRVVAGAAVVVTAVTLFAMNALVGGD